MISSELWSFGLFLYQSAFCDSRKKLTLAHTQEKTHITVSFPKVLQDSDLSAAAGTVQPDTFIGFNHSWESMIEINKTFFP